MLSSEFETIYYYDHSIKKWIGHPRFLPAEIDDFELLVGRSYMLYSAKDFSYTFTGRPELMVRLVEGISGSRWPGTNSSTFDYTNSLRLSVRKSGILLEWDKIEVTDNTNNQIKYYELYRKNTRGALNLSNAGSFKSDENSLKLITATRLNKYQDDEIFELFENTLDFKSNREAQPAEDASNRTDYYEYHYIVVPVDEFGRRGSSTFSKSISISKLDGGYNSFGLSFLNSEKMEVHEFIMELGLLDTDTIYYYDRSNQQWIGHPRFLPGFRDNPKMEIGEGYLIYLLIDSQKLLFQYT
jgi:hypothetical protein